MIRFAWTYVALEHQRFNVLDKDEVEKLVEESLTRGTNQQMFKKSSGRRKGYVTLKDGRKVEVQFNEGASGVITVQAVLLNPDTI